MAIHKKYAKSYEVLESNGSIQDIYNRFISEYDWNIKRIGFFKALTEWLQGLALDIPFYNHDIMETFNLNEKQLGNYWSFMAMRLTDLFKKEGLIK